MFLILGGKGGLSDGRNPSSVPDFYVTLRFLKKKERSVTSLGLERGGRGGGGGARIAVRGAGS